MNEQIVAESVLLSLEGALKTAPQDVQEKVSECKTKIRQLVAEYGDAGRLALSVVGLEMTLEVQGK